MAKKQPSADRKATASVQATIARGLGDSHMVMTAKGRPMPIKRVRLHEGGAYHKQAAITAYTMLDVCPRSQNKNQDLTLEEAEGNHLEKVLKRAETDADFDWKRAMGRVE